MTSKWIPSFHLFGSAFLTAGVLSALPLNHACAQEPEANLRLEVPFQKLARGEAFRFSIELTNTGDAAIPVIRDRQFISTRQLFLVTEVLETQDATGLPSIEPGGSLHVTIGGDEMYAGSNETATWNTVTQWETDLLQPGDTLRLAYHDLLLYDLPTVCPRVKRFTWHIWWLIGDEAWAKSNVVEYEMVDLEVAKDGDLIRRLDTPASIRTGRPDSGLPIHRLDVGDEQWLYRARHRLAVMPKDVDPAFYWDSSSYQTWIVVPGRPDLSVQINGYFNSSPFEEATPPKPEFLVPPPDGPLKRSLP